MEEGKKSIAILGSTGSIGTQALEVVAANPGHFSVEVLTAGNQADLLIQQAINFIIIDVHFMAEKAFRCQRCYYFANC